MEIGTSRYPGALYEIIALPLNYRETLIRAAPLLWDAENSGARRPKWKPPNLTSNLALDAD